MARLNWRVDKIDGAPSGLQREVFFYVFSGFASTPPKARIYKQGDTPPAFSNMLFISGTFWRLVASDQVGFSNPLDLGTYNVEYQDSNGNIAICSVTIEDIGTDCNHGRCTIFVNDTGIGVQSSDSAVSSISIDGGSMFKAASTSFITTWSNAEIAALGISGIIANITFRSDAADCNSIQDAFLDTVTYPPLEVSESHTDVTTIGGSDGTITLSPSGGSGNYSYAWGDGPTTQNRSGLSAGTYTVAVTDLITTEEVDLSITIIEPQAPSHEGSLLFISPLNSIQFVIDDGSGVQNPDNILLCDQVFPGFTKTNYYQKIEKNDIIITQFNSDFGSHSLVLKDYKTGEIVKVFDIVLKEENINQVEDFNISIRNHTTVGQSRVYFSSGTIPIPLSVGDSFQILNNADGFDGSYSIVDIITDTFLNVQYLVINLNYSISSPSSSATGRFTLDNEDFNVYESSMSFLDVATGQYYLELNAFDDSDNIITAISEPIDLKVSHPKTLLIEYSNVDNAFDITWTTGYIGRVRVEALLFQRLPGGERSTTRNSDFGLVKTAAKKTRGFLLQTYMLPPYLHEKLSVIFDLDEWRINGVEYQTAEAYQDPQYIDRFPLSNSSIRIEQANWFRKYNSNDIGSVSDGGFLITEQGFIKL